MKRSNGTIDLSLDYHAHVLPSGDHGSDGLETSLRQLDMAAAAGIRTVCATPHFYPHRESVESFLRRRAECAQLLRAHLPEQVPQICLGAEVLICDGMERLDGLHRLCREGTNELLHRSVLERFRFREDVYHEDYALWLAILRGGGSAAGCTEVLADWRISEQSRSFDKRAAAVNRWRIYRDVERLSLPRSVCAFFAYALHGVRKHGRI